MCLQTTLPPSPEVICKVSALHTQREPAAINRQQQYLKPGQFGVCLACKPSTQHKTPAQVINGYQMIAFLVNMLIPGERRLLIVSLQLQLVTISSGFHLGSIQMYTDIQKNQSPAIFNSNGCVLVHSN